MKQEILNLIAGGKISSAAAKLANNAGVLSVEDFDELNKRIKQTPVYARTRMGDFPTRSGKSGSRPVDGGSFHHRHK